MLQGNGLIFLVCVQESEQKRHVLYPAICGGGRSIRLQLIPLFPIKLLVARATGIEPVLQGFGDPLTYQLSKRV